jgi:predicted RNA polymerase sigma factor
VIEALLRELAPQALATVAPRYRDFSAAEDAVQEAPAAAAGVSATPGPGGKPPNMPIEVRQVTDGPPPEML